MRSLSERVHRYELVIPGFESLQVCSLSYLADYIM